MQLLINNIEGFVVVDKALIYYIKITSQAKQSLLFKTILIPIVRIKLI